MDARLRRGRSSVASRLNGELVRHAFLRRFVTCFYAVLDTASGAVSFTNAGHPPPMVVSPSGALARLSHGGTVLGAFEDAAFEEGRLVLAAGDRLVLFTDGITEAMRGADEEFGDERLAAAVRRPVPSSGALADQVFADVRGFAAGPLQDDATILVVTHRGGRDGI